MFSITLTVEVTGNDFINFPLLFLWEQNVNVLLQYMEVTSQE